MRPGRAIAVLASAALLAGCGASDRQQVQSKVQQFFQAIAAHQYRTLCEQVLAPALTARFAAQGLRCEQAMGISLAGVHRPILSIGRVTVTGNTAQVVTLTGAAGQQAAFETIELVKTGNGWRIASLAAPELTRHP